MQLFFSLGLLVCSLAFTIYGFNTLDLFDSIGRPGPGYFPLIIGGLLILTTSINCIKDFKVLKSHNSDAKDHLSHTPKYFKDSLITILLIGIFILTLNTLGSILSMILFVFLFLLYFNKGKWSFNIIYSVLLPLGVYLLFDVLLQAGLPRGIFDY